MSGLHDSEKMLVVGSTDGWRDSTLGNMHPRGVLPWGCTAGVEMCFLWMVKVRRMIWLLLGRYMSIYEDGDGDDTDCLI